MSEKINSSRIGDTGKPKPVFAHGKLLAVEAEYREWADDIIGSDGKPVKDEVTGKKLKVEGTGGVRPYVEWVKLPKSKRGEKWIVSIDQKMFHPDWENNTTRGLMLGFQDWVQYNEPSIKDMVGTSENQLDTFLDRAYTESWYVEIQLIPTGFYQDKPQDTFKFIRMTQDVTEIRAWHNERYPKQEVVVPDELIAQAKLIWKKFAKGDADKFNGIVSENDELNPYLVQLAELSKNW